jgi:hypothetical protein
MNEDRPRYQRCFTCTKQKKGCTWKGTESVVPTGKAKEDLMVVDAPSVSIATSKAGPSKEKGTKRKKPDDTPEPTSVRTPSTRSNRAEVVLNPLRIPTPPPHPPSPLPSYTIVNLPSPFSSVPTADSGPPPSVIATSSTSSSFSSSSQVLEIAILRSQLDAANEVIRRERERSQQEMRALQEQFDRERAAYQTFINSINSARRQ